MAGLSKWSDSVLQTIKNIFELAEMPKEGVLSILLQDNEHFNVTLFLMPAGQYLSPHTSSMPASIYIISGKADFLLGDTENEVKPGDQFYMPPNYTHAVRAKEDLMFLLHLRK
jgi:quercetin dioxygenase-like cupin family protein